MEDQRNLQARLAASLADSQRLRDEVLSVIKTLLANENQPFGLRIAFDRKPRLLTSIDGYARFRDVRVRPRAFRVPAQTRAGSGCTSATACCVQAETKPSHCRL